MSENTLRVALRRTGYSNEDMTPHGFRAMAKSIMVEKLNRFLESKSMSSPLTGRFTIQCEGMLNVSMDSSLPARFPSMCQGDRLVQSRVVWGTAVVGRIQGGPRNTEHRRERVPGDFDLARGPKARLTVPT